MSYRYRSSSSSSVAAIAIVVAAMLLIGGCNAVVQLATRDDVTFTIQEKGIKRGSGNSGDKYLLYTDKGVYQNTDSWLALKFRSSDLYGKLKVGRTYDCTAQGLRIPFFSSYKNVLDCDEVSNGQPQEASPR